MGSQANKPLGAELVQPNKDFQVIVIETLVIE